jgi:hypothetical protein
MHITIIVKKKKLVKEKRKQKKSTTAQIGTNDRGPAPRQTG